MRCFVDTNVLVYAHDRASDSRSRTARELLEELWGQRAGVVSTQVLQELYVNVRRKASRPLSAAVARRLIEDYLAWEVVVNNERSVLEAIELEERYRVSFWDALIVQAANESACEVLYTEDLNHGQLYGAVRAVDPFTEV